MRFALLGDPVAHSKSPRMHAAAYRAHKLAHTYEALRVGPDDLAGMVAELRSGAFAGLNVTVPHKRRILDYVDAVDATAQIAGAANTLVRGPGDRITAYNTDSPALAEELRALAPERSRAAWEGATALVIGSGGAARSAIVALGLELRAARVSVRARGAGDPARVASFAVEMQALLAAAGSPTRVVAEAWAPSAVSEPGVAAIVQATSAGMTGAEPGEAVADVVAWGELPARAVALDVVYAPPETPFLRAAGQHGVRAANGIGMLARQGALAFSLWLGGAPPYNAMLTALM